MKDHSSGAPTRRGFLRDMLITGSIMMLNLRIDANIAAPKETVLSCGTDTKFSPTSTISSVKSGNWSDPETWNGAVPGPTDTVSIQPDHEVLYDVALSTIKGLTTSQGGILRFNPSKTCKLQSSGNFVIEGRLIMRPDSADVDHALVFIDIDERKFVGGGMNVISTDIGLWVMGAGIVDLKGAEKTSWTNVIDAIAKSSTTITVKESSGWRVGDELIISPTESPKVGPAFISGFEEVKIAAIQGNTITLNKALARAHPKVNGMWTAEVMNVSRNVRIEGTAGGRSHIFLRSTSRQFIQYAAFRYLGPRKDRSGDGIGELVPGRYGLHFHHCMDGSRKSLVKGNVIRDAGNHCYVPHVSHEITFVDNISYNTLETSFWWDPGDPTHDVVYDHNIVAKCNFVERALNMNAEDAPTFSSSGFALNTGDGNVCKNNVVVAGSQGDFAEGGAYNWEAVINEGVWIFDNNIAHNSGCGLRVWQNSTRNHIIENFFAYHNGMGIFHGAYANSYTYNGGILYANKMQIKAASANSNRVRVENLLIDGAGIVDNGIEVIHSPLPGERPVLLRNITIKNCTAASVLDTVEPEVHSIDIVHCTLEQPVILHPVATQNEVIRIQPLSGQPYMIAKSGTSNIARFAADNWGTGKGLKAEYFNDIDFTSPAFTRIDSNISFSEWSAGVHYAITGSRYSVRWTGQIEAQFTEDYTFIMGSGGGFRLWVNNVQLMNSWSDNSEAFTSQPIALEAKKRYDIRLEYFNIDQATGANLLWQSPSTPAEYVPQSQLYSEPLPPLEEPEEPGSPSEPSEPGPVEPDSNYRVTTIAREFIEVRSTDQSPFALFNAGGQLLDRGSILPGLNRINVARTQRGMLMLNIKKAEKTYRVLKL